MTNVTLENVRTVGMRGVVGISGFAAVAVDSVIGRAVTVDDGDNGSGLPYVKHCINLVGGVLRVQRGFGSAVSYRQCANGEER